MAARHSVGLVTHWYSAIAIDRVQSSTHDSRSLDTPPPNRIHTPSTSAVTSRHSPLDRAPEVVHSFSSYSRTLQTTSRTMRRKQSQ